MIVDGTDVAGTENTVWSASAATGGLDSCRDGYGPWLAHQTINQVFDLGAIGSAGGGRV